MTAQLFDKTSAKLRLRLIAIIAILIGPLAVLQAVEIYQVRTTRTKITQDRAYELAKANAARYQDTIDDAKSVLDTLSHVGEVVKGSAANCSAFLKTVTKSHSSRSTDVAALPVAKWIC